MTPDGCLRNDVAERDTLSAHAPTQMTETWCFINHRGRRLHTIAPLRITTPFITSVENTSTKVPAKLQHGAASPSYPYTAQNPPEPHTQTVLPSPLIKHFRIRLLLQNRLPPFFPQDTKRLVLAQEGLDKTSEIRLAPG